MQELRCNPSYGVLSVETHRRAATGNTKSQEVAGALAGTAPSSTARNSVTRLCGTEAGDQRGGEWEPIKISSEIQTVGLYPENHPSPQAFWPKFGIAMEKLNQHKRPRTSERNHKANRKRIRKLQN